MRKSGFVLGQLPQLEKVKGHFVAKRSYNEEETKKPLKLPKCPNHCINKNAMFWIDPLGLWVPIRQVSPRVNHTAKLGFTGLLKYGVVHT